jgi:hypothetical protein
MAMNIARVIGGGLVAGVVMNAIDFVGNGLWLAERWKDAAMALNPRLVEPTMEAQAITGWVASDFLFGILIVWAYAAMRPRFGSGPSTAIKAALFVWAVSHIAYGSFIFTGLYGATVVMLSAISGLIAAVAGGLAGAWMYQEEPVRAGRTTAV